MKRVILILPVFLSFLLEAQDYAVTLKFDTVRGKTSIQTYDVVDRILVTEGKKKDQFTAVQVRSVHIGKDEYRTVLGENGYRMMKLIQDGTLSLYMGRSKTGFYYDVQYLVKRDGSAMQVPNLAFKKIMIGYLNDCAVIKEKVDKGDLGKKDLELIIKEYNACIEAQTQAVVKQKPVNTNDPRIQALTSLREKLEKSTITGQKDMLDVLRDITEKVKKDEAVPNYLLESLKNGLKDSSELKTELDNVISLLKVQ
jgi:hypothetical protein